MNCVGQFHQSLGAKKKYASSQLLAQRHHSVSPMELRTTIQVHRTRSYAQVLNYILNIIVFQPFLLLINYITTIWRHPYMLK